jgi:uncharacterized protein YukE
MGQGQGTLSRAAAMVDEARCDFEHLDGQLAQHLAEVRTAWRGDGSRAFQALGQAWSHRQHAIVSALRSFEEALRSTEHDNLRTDDAQSSSFTRTQHRLG